MGARRLRKGKGSWGMEGCRLSMRERRRTDQVAEDGTKHGQGDEKTVKRPEYSVLCSAGKSIDLFSAS